MGSPGAREITSAEPRRMAGRRHALEQRLAEAQARPGPSSDRDRADRAAAIYRRRRDARAQLEVLMFDIAMYDEALADFGFNSAASLALEASDWWSEVVGGYGSRLERAREALRRVKEEQEAIEESAREETRRQAEEEAAANVGKGKGRAGPSSLFRK